MPPYRPAFQSQFGYGTIYDDENCAATAGCMALARHTLGRKHATPPQMRNETDEPNRQDGLSLSNIEYAWREGWDEDLVNPLPFEPWHVVAANIRQGRGAIIFGDCRTVRQGRRCPGRFPADHALYVNEWDAQRQQFLTYDPADRTTSEGVRWVSEDVLKRYAGNWTLNEGAPPGMANAAYTRITGDSGGPGPGPEPEPEPEPHPLPAGCAGSLLTLLGVIK